MTTVKRCGLSAFDKSELLRKYNKLTPMTQAQAAAQLKISQSTLCKQLKNREAIVRMCSDSNMNKSRLRRTQ